MAFASSYSPEQGLAGRRIDQTCIEARGLRLNRWQRVDKYWGQAFTHVAQAFRGHFRQIENPMQSEIWSSVL